MDLKTSFAFYFVSLMLYLIVLTAMAVADKRVLGTRWLAYSVLIEMVKIGLQVMGNRIPRLWSTMVANELNMVAFFTMYLGLRWFVHRDPLRSKTGPILLITAMAVYFWMFVLHIPYAFHVAMAMVLWICGATLLLLWRQREERFRMPAAIVAGVLQMQVGLVLFRSVLAWDIYRHGSDWRPPANDTQWNLSMLLIVLLSNCLLILYVWFAAAEMYSAVEATAGIDALTGCLNRRALMKLAAHELARSARSGMPMSIVAIDLDHFKGVNDTYGHAGGDATLVAVVGLIKNRLRSVDVVARTGGEEFLLLLPDTDAAGGTIVVEGLRQAVEAMQLEFEGGVIRTTLSAGVTQCLPRGDTWTAMLNRADRALYGAKGAGRNCVLLDEEAARLPRRAIGVREEPEVGEEVAVRQQIGALRLIRKRLG
jgi:diguanylate cyclase (GGDEF)-like protein